MGKEYAKTPTVYQMEASECGAAALSMILGYYGRFMPLEQMRIECGVSRDGSSAKNILLAARKIGLETHGYRKSLEKLIKLTPPCIIHWNFNHFVVFEGQKGKYFYINDPVSGRRRITYKELDDSYTGVVLTFNKTSDFSPSKKTDSFLQFFLKSVSQEKDMLSLVFSGLLMIFPGIVIPAFSRVFIDGILVERNTGWLWGLLIVMLFTLVFQAAVRFYRGTLLLRFQNKVSLISAHSFLTHFFKLPISFFTQRSSGDLSRRVDNNNDLSIFMTSDLAQTALDIMAALFYLVILFAYSPLLTLIGLLIIAVNLLIMKFGAAAIGDMTIKAQQDIGRMFGALYAGISASASLKASGTENEFAKRIQGYYAKTIEMDQKMGRRQQALDVIPDVARQVTNIVILIVGGLLVISGELTEGMLVAFISLLACFMEPIDSLATFIEKIKTAQADLRRVEDIYKYRQDQRFDCAKKEDIDHKLSGNISMRGVAFGYGPLTPPVIEDFEFDLKSGSSIALVGASGSGKTTVARLCSGLYRPMKGEILFDDISFDRLPEEVAAASIATVSQDITLFSGTIRDNLTMWNSSILWNDVIKAAKDACIHDFITARPGAYDFMVSENGANLSGGQRQRLEIARALAINPSILILDEATSALDPVTEKEIMDNIKRRGCTCIVVAHRLSAIRDCDEILVMDRGRIVQRGRHDELIKQEGLYKSLVENAN
ncbi:MAG: NHLP family bacteriocin export ABC transporter peptidase/permease/ATPase subunit [Butyrivibrio sp.]|nr:NHLP family bacteriocin export ABC transporter peptidase/permease/ATPase subunit [Butyrivibrio sp.]